VEFAWVAFWQLHGDRPMSAHGFGAPMGATIIESLPGPIPFSAVDRYASRFEIEGEAFDRLLFFVSELDSEFLNHAREESKKRWEKMGK
jgi:hypothetical protein